MKHALLVLSIWAVGFSASGFAQNEGRKLIGEDRAQQVALSKVGAGRVEFIERRGDEPEMVYEVYVMKGDTLFKTLIEAYNGALDTIIVDAQNGRRRLEARMFAKKRAELVAKAAVAGEVMRWRLKHEDGIWFYRFQIETPEGKIKEVYVNEYNFKVTRIKSPKIHRKV